MKKHYYILYVTPKAERFTRKSRNNNHIVFSMDKAKTNIAGHITTVNLISETCNLNKNFLTNRDGRTLLAINIKLIKETAIRLTKDEAFIHSI